jgi:hypothetical protein
MGYTVRSDPTLMKPMQTVTVTRTTAPAPTVPVVTSTDDADLWVVAGPPPATPPVGAESGDAWIDVATGNVYVLTE